MRRRPVLFMRPRTMWSPDYASLETLTSVHTVHTAGLDSFVVGLTNDDPMTTAPCFLCTYTICHEHNASVAAGETAVVNCAQSAETFRYVIIQASDMTARALCLAEVAVYDKSKLQITFRPTPTSHCISESVCWLSTVGLYIIFFLHCLYQRLFYRVLDSTTLPCLSLRSRPFESTVGLT